MEDSKAMIGLGNWSVRRSAATLVCMACIASAQTRSVKGIVTNLDGLRLKSAVVKLKNTRSLQIRSYITRKDGSYYFHGLSPDIDYELKAERDGSVSEIKTLSRFDSARSATIDLRIPVRK